MPTDFPRVLWIDGKAYKVAGQQERTPRWQVNPVPSQPGDPTRERVINLGDASACLIGGRRHGSRPTEHGVANVSNADTSYEDRLGVGPAVTVITLSAGDSNHSAGSIDQNLVIGGGQGQPGIDGGISVSGPTKIWSDGDDGDGGHSRYVYVLAGGRIKVINPVNDTIVETTEFAGVDGGDSARWLGKTWVALRGDKNDFVRYIDKPYDGTSTDYKTADFTAYNVHAGPDAFYRSYSNFASPADVALLKKTTSDVLGEVTADDNWAPSSGETIGQPGDRVRRLATLGERLVAGKSTGVLEFDSDFTTRHYLEWAKDFRWEHAGNGILALGQSGEFISNFRRGLYLLPQNKSIGVEQLSGNESDKKGRYTFVGPFDGAWVYAFLQNPTTDDTHIAKMRPRRLPGPGLFESHFPVTLENKEVLTAALWPGTTVSSTRYGPRLWFGHGNDVAYIRLGETMPDVDDANARFRTTSWTVQWPIDDFCNPSTLKAPYRVEAVYENCAGTTGITWAVSDDEGVTFVDLDDDGTGAGNTAVTADGFHRRFGPKSNSITARTLVFRMTGTGSSATAQQRIIGQPVVTLLEQPDTVDQIQCTVQLEPHKHNDANAGTQWRALKALKGTGPKPVRAEWDDRAPNEEFTALVAASERAGQVATDDEPGVILVTVVLRALDFSD